MEPLGELNSELSRWRLISKPFNTWASVARPGAAQLVSARLTPGCEVECVTVFMKSHRPTPPAAQMSKQDRK